MRVLLLSYHYPPTSEVGGLRAARLAASLRSRGADVTVIAGPVTESVDRMSGGVDIDVIRVEPALNLRARYLRLRGSPSRVAVTDKTDTSAQTWTPPASTPFLKRHIASAMWLPDDRQGWIMPAAARATAMLRSRPFDILYSTSPPASVQIAALVAKRRTGVRWVAEFRDPWTDNPWKPAFVRSAWSDAAERWLERRVLRDADLIVAVTGSTAGMLRRRLPAARHDRVITVMNGIEAIAPADPRPSGAVRSVVYAGKLGHGRDPRPFLRAVAALRSRGAVAEDLRIDFIGDCRFYRGVSLADFASDLGLGAVLRFHDSMAHDRCLEHIQAADLLLLLAQDQPLQVPNKLFEYLGARRPILAFADRDGETADMLRRVDGHFIVDVDDGVQTERVVADALSCASSRSTPDTEALVESWTWHHQFASLYANLESMHELG